jgi:tRNA(fMet)-specific endonuclease VapC
VLRVLDEFATVVPVAPVPVAAGAIYGAVRATLEARGQPIGNNDLWIAAHARAADLTLITANGREFARVPGLAVESWA